MTKMPWDISNERVNCPLYTGSVSEFVAFTILWLSSVEIGWFSQKRPFFELILR